MRSLEDVIGYRFSNAAVLVEALTHKSYSAEHGSAPDNERLEFLGDSVLGLAVARYIYLKEPHGVEGRLSKAKAVLVSKPSLAAWARAINLGGYLMLGQGEEVTGGRNRESVLANAMEAVLGAVFLDGGFEASAKLVASWLDRQPVDGPCSDYKSELQEYFQKIRQPLPEYAVLQTVGPEHDKIFTVSVNSGGAKLAEGSGKTKKEAEQAAAQSAIETLRQKARKPKKGGPNDIRA